MVSAPESIVEPPVMLRVWEASDAIALERTIRQNRDHLGRWMLWANSDLGDADVRRKWIEQTLADFAVGSEYSYGIFEGPLIVGGCSLHTVTADSARLGYWIAADQCGRGLAVCAARALIGCASAVGLDRVEIRTDQANAASRKVAEKLGFSFVRSEAHPIQAPGHTGVSVVYGLELHGDRSAT